MGLRGSSVLMLGWKVCITMQQTAAYRGVQSVFCLFSHFLFCLGFAHLVSFRLCLSCSITVFSLFLCSCTHPHSLTVCSTPFCDAAGVTGGENKIFFMSTLYSSLVREFTYIRQGVIISLIKKNKRRVCFWREVQV